MVFTHSWLTDFTIFLSISVITLVAYIQYVYSYWKRKGIDGPAPQFPFGNTKDIAFNRTLPASHWQKIYMDMKKKGYKLGGVYILTRPTLIVCDPEILKNIMVKDFDSFENRLSYTNEEIEPLTGDVVRLTGQRWKKIRSKITSVFTSGKLRGMFQVMAKNGDDFNKHLEQYAKSGEAIDIRTEVGKCAVDIMGSAAFGIECNSLKDPKSRFYDVAKLVFSVTEPFGSFFGLLSVSYPTIFAKIGRKALGDEIEQFYTGVSKDILEYRKTNGHHANDFMDLLKNLMENEETGDDFDFNAVAAQVFGFLSSGFESSSVSFCLYEISNNQDIQDKVRSEVEEVLNNHNHEFTYESLKEMTYLHQVVEETLRKYPSFPHIGRVCTKEYPVPDSDLVIPEGTCIILPLLAFHRDPEFYPDPDTFDPDRFTEENKKKRHTFAYVPFGAGPRVCIALRYVMIQMKVMLAQLLTKYRFEVAHEKMQFPLVFDHLELTLNVKGNVWLHVKDL